MLYYGNFRCPCMQERKVLHITLNGTLRQYECPIHPIMALMPDLRYHVRNNGTSPTIENKTGAGILNGVVYRNQYMFGLPAEIWATTEKVMIKSILNSTYLCRLWDLFSAAVLEWLILAFLNSASREICVLGVVEPPAAPGLDSSTT